MTDLGDTIAPNSAQLDAVDLLDGPRIFTITKVEVKAASDQPVTIWLAEFDRPWKPGLSMRRVLVNLWGKDGDVYVGRQVELFCDGTVEFGGQPVGGIRISRMTDINGAQNVPLLISKGRNAMFPVKPLAHTQPAPTAPSLDQRIETATAAYARASVTVPMLEARVALSLDEWSEQTVAELEALFQRLKAGETTKDAEFPDYVAAVTGDPS